MGTLDRMTLPHVEKDLSELFSDLEQRMQGTTIRGVAECRQVVLLELSLLPCTAVFEVPNSQRLLRLP
jgi:hypothetical protein